MEPNTNTRVVDQGQAQAFLVAVKPSAQPAAKAPVCCTMRPWIEYERDGRTVGFFFDLRDHDY